MKQTFVTFSSNFSWRLQVYLTSLQTFYAYRAGKQFILSFQAMQTIFFKYFSYPPSRKIMVRPLNLLFHRVRISQYNCVYLLYESAFRKRGMIKQVSKYLFICIPAVHIISFCVSFLSLDVELNKLAGSQCMGLHSSAGRALQR